jgi:hypothetical protein
MDVLLSLAVWPGWLILAVICLYRLFMRLRLRLPSGIEDWLPLRGRWLKMLCAMSAALLVAVSIVPVCITVRNPGGLQGHFFWEVLFPPR